MLQVKVMYYYFIVFTKCGVELRHSTQSLNIGFSAYPALSTKKRYAEQNKYYKYKLKRQLIS